MTINGGISFWYATDHTATQPPRAPLTGHTTADVVIVGGGYTGLWTAYYLKAAAPDLRVTVLEQKFCGYGASGRNGGWLYNGIAGRDRYAELHGHQAALRLQHAMNDTVTEVIDTAAKEGIDADIHRGGVLEVARTPAQLSRLKAFHTAELAFGETDRELYDATDTRARIDIADAVGSTWTPHGARIHPSNSSRASPPPANASASSSTNPPPSPKSPPAAPSPPTAPSAPPTSCAAPKASPQPSRARSAHGSR